MWFKCVSAFLILVPLAAQAQRGTVMLPLSQPESPAMLVRMVHGIDDFLQAATLKNVGTEPITGYRIGWVEVYPEGKDKVGLGYRVEVPEGIDPSNTTEVPAQGVSSRSSREGAFARLLCRGDSHREGCMESRPGQSRRGSSQDGGSRAASR